MIKLCGQEERALWSSAVVVALREGFKSEIGGLEEQAFVILTAGSGAIADAIVLEFRKRNGSQP